MGKTKKPDYGPTIDAMNKDVIASYKYPWATGDYDPNTMSYNYSLSPDEQQTYSMATSIRNDLLKSLGLASTGEDAYTKAFMNESLRLSQPKLENSLIGRGLGGSSVYKNALTDLINQAATQAVIQGRSARLNDLSTLEGLLTNIYNLGGNTMNQVAQTGLNQQQLQLQKAGVLKSMEDSRVSNAQASQAQLWQNLTNAALLAAAIPSGGLSLLATPATGTANLASNPYVLSSLQTPSYSPGRYQSLIGAFS